MAHSVMIVNLLLGSSLTVPVELISKVNLQAMKEFIHGLIKACFHSSWMICYLRANFYSSRDKLVSQYDIVPCVQ